MTREWTFDPTLDLFRVVPLREHICRVALGLDGLEAGQVSHRPRWLEILGPVVGRWDLDRPFHCWRDDAGMWHTEGVSTCGLVAEGIWRECGVDFPALWRPYNGAGPNRDKAIARAKRFAEELGAWRTSGRPDPGDYLVWKAPEHVSTVVGWDAGAVVSVDGGQVCKDDGLQAIYRKQRRWGSRPVLGWVDASRLPVT